MFIDFRFRLILTVFFALSSITLSAKEVEGYLITKNGEKVFGSIRVSSVNYPSGAITIGNINYLPLYVSVFFKEKNAKRFKEYYADEVDGFSFVYQNQEVFFFSIELPYREWGEIKSHKKFLRLLINGHLILFDSKSLVLYGNNYTEVTDYFISDAKNKVSNITDNEYSTLEDYLVKGLKIDKEFLRNQPYKINIRNIKNIILNYNRWYTQKP